VRNQDAGTGLAEQLRYRFAHESPMFRRARVRARIRGLLAKELVDRGGISRELEC
jgi:hypothetical protein